MASRSLSSLRTIAITLATPWLLFVVRPLGLIIPRSVLWILLWPIGLAFSIWELTFAEPLARRFDIWMRSGYFSRDFVPRFLHLVLSRAQLNATKMLVLWGDRLANCNRGFCYVQNAKLLNSPGPIILATLHYGPMTLLPHWLRGSSRPAAIVTLKPYEQLPWYRRHIGHLRDRAAGLVDLPICIPVSQPWAMYDHLRSHELLIVAVDGLIGRVTHQPQIDGLALEMSAGALRLARIVGATVIPCLIQSEPNLGFTIHLGEPVLAEDVSDRRRHGEACEHLLREFKYVIDSAPAECSYELMRNFSSFSPDAADSGVNLPHLQTAGA